jgi:hypothetical protein
MGLAETSATIWRQRELLTTLLFKLEVEGLLLAAGRTRWLGAATSEVDLVLGQVRTVEVLRSIEVDALAESLGLPPAPSLAEIVRAIDPPWDEAFAEHRSGLVAIAAEIEAVVRSNRQLLTAGHAAVTSAMRAVAAATGSDLPRRPGPRPLAPVPSP